MATLDMQTPKERKKILPLIMALGNKIIKEIGLVEKIDTTVPWDQLRWKVSPGNLIKALILGTFADMRAPLSHVGKHFKDVDTEYLFGENATEKSINQYSIGEALERLSECDYSGLYETLALKAIEMNEIPTQRLHADTTTISFYGEYDVDDLEISEEEKEELLKIERGYNKDGRPQCKQVVVGHIVNEEGIVLSSKVMDGSTSDVEWNKLALEQYHNLLGKGMKEGIFVADSKLVTQELVESMTNPENPVTFVSRCPSSFSNKLESRMIAKAYESGTFKELGQQGKGVNASYYRGISYIEEVFGQRLRLLVLHSSALEKKAHKALEKARYELEPLLKDLQKKRFACQEDAQRECSLLENSKKTALFDCQFTIEKQTTEKWPRGRRSAETKPSISENFAVRIGDCPFNAKAKEQFLQNESCFVIISNIMPEETDDYSLLGIYKGQQVVENSFRLLKEPCLASVIYLKKPNRIEALSMVLTLSLLIRAILQYKMREGLKKHQQENPDIALRAGWDNKPIESPTFKLLFEHTISCYFEKESVDHYSFSFSDTDVEYQVMTLLQLMNVTLKVLIE